MRLFDIGLVGLFMTEVNDIPGNHRDHEVFTSVPI